MGKRAGAEVIQVYRHCIGSATHQPEQQLCGFTRVSLSPTKPGTVNITLEAESFCVFDHGAQQWALEAGPVQLRIGSSSRDIHLTQSINVASKQNPQRSGHRHARSAFPPMDATSGNNGVGRAFQQNAWTPGSDRRGHTPLSPQLLNSRNRYDVDWQQGKRQSGSCFLGGMGLEGERTRPRAKCLRKWQITCHCERSCSFNRAESVITKSTACSPQRPPIRGAKVCH